MLLSGIPSTGLTPMHACAFQNPGPLFHAAYIMVVFVLNCLRCDMVLCVDIDGTVDHPVIKIEFRYYIKLSGAENNTRNL